VTDRFWAGFGVGCLVSFIAGAVLAAAASVAAMAAFGSYAAAVAQQQQATAPAAPADAPPAADAPRGKSNEAADADDAILRDEGAIQDALEEEDFDRAESLARALVARHPGDAECRALLQTVRVARAVAAEDVAGADRLLKEALEGSMDIDPGTELGVAELWLDEGEPERARIIADRVFERVSEDETGDDGYDHYIQGAALVLRGLARAELGDPPGAIADIEAALKLAPDPAAEKEWRQYLEEVREKAQ
jgi:tetratricopeptide (TPR) repeat protein